MLCEIRESVPLKQVNGIKSNELLTMPFTRMAIPLRFIATGEGNVGQT